MSCVLALHICVSNYTYTMASHQPKYSWSGRIFPNGRSHNCFHRLKCINFFETLYVLPAHAWHISNLVHSEFSTGYSPCTDWIVASTFDMLRYTNNISAGNRPHGAEWINGEHAEHADHAVFPNNLRILKTGVKSCSYMYNLAESTWLILYFQFGRITLLSAEGYVLVSE